MMTNKTPVYVVAECRPTTDEDGYADIVINDETYVFQSVEPAERLKSAILITIDINRANPSHKHIVLHHQSLSLLMQGIQGETINT